MSLKIKEKILDFPVPAGFRYEEAIYNDETLEYSIFGGVVQISQNSFEKLLERVEYLEDREYDHNFQAMKYKDLLQELHIYKEKFGELPISITDDVLLAGRPGKLTSDHKRFIRLHLYDTKSGSMYRQLKDFWGYEGSKQTVANFMSKLRKIEKEKTLNAENYEALDLDWDELSKDPFEELSDKMRREIRFYYGFDKNKDKTIKELSDKRGIREEIISLYIDIYEAGGGWQ